MNNLEWIEKQIEKYKCFYEEDKDYKEIQEGWGRLIVRFQQIKTELEAWEVIKNLCSINYFSHNIDLPMEYREKITKALEIQDENL